MRHMLRMWLYPTTRRVRGVLLHLSGRHPWVVVVHVDPELPAPVYRVRCERCNVAPDDLVLAQYIGNALHDRTLQHALSNAFPRPRE